MTIHCAHLGTPTIKTFWRKTRKFCYVIFKFLLMSIFILKEDSKCIGDSIRHFICFPSLKSYNIIQTGLKSLGIQ